MANDLGNYVRREKKPPVKPMTPAERFARLKAQYQSRRTPPSPQSPR